MVTGVTLDLKSKDSGRPPFTGLLIDGLRNAINADGCDDIVFRKCTFLNCGGGAVGMIRCHNWWFDDCDVHGAGLSEWAARGADCFGVKQCHGIRWTNCRVSGASHDLFTCLDGSSGLEWIKCVFGRLDPRCRAIGNGASHFTVKRGVNKILVRDCYFTGAPDWEHSVPNPDGGNRRINAAGMQLSGEGHQILDSIFDMNALGLLISSDKDGQVLKDCIFRGLRILNCSPKADPEGNPGSGIVMQQGGPAGSISNNRFEDCEIWGALQLTHLALIGAGPDLFGNRFVNCKFGKGPLVIAGRSFPTVENAAMAYPAFQSCRTISVSSTPGAPPLIEPPVKPPTGPPSQPPPTTMGTPRIDRLEPATAAAGDTVVIIGEDFGTDPGYVTLQTDEGIFRFSKEIVQSWTPTRVEIILIKEIISGPLRVRRIGDRVGGILSEPVTLTIGEIPPAPPLPPPTPLPDPTFDGIDGVTLIASALPDQVLTIVGLNLDREGLQVYWGAEKLEPLVSWDRRLTVRTPSAVEGVERLSLRMGETSIFGPLLAIKED